MFSLRFGNGPFNWGLPRRPRKGDAARRKPRPQQRAAASSGSGGIEAYQQRVSVSSAAALPPA